jgi:hypothetical protein
MTTDRICAHEGCARDDTAFCQYIDGSGKECRTQWCPKHMRAMHGADVCRRHAGLLRAVGAELGETGLPLVDNRAPSLVNWIFRDIEFAVRALLATDGNIDDVAADTTVHLTSNGAGGVLWQQSMAIHGTAAHRVTVAVDDGTPTVVSIRVDNTGVFEEEPPWIARRLGRAPSESDPYADDTRFYGTIRMRIADGLRA